MRRNAVVTILALTTIFASVHSFPAQDRPPSLRLVRTVVRRILIATIKPEEKPRKVRIVEGIVRKAWLPAIRNIEFELIPKNSDENKRHDSYFFDEVIWGTDGYKISFGKNQGACSASGDIWGFKIVRGKLKLDRAGGFNTDCDAVPE